MPPEPKLAALASVSHTLFVVRLTLCCNLSILTKNKPLSIIFSLSLTYFQVYGTSKSSLTPANKNNLMPPLPYLLKRSPFIFITILICF